jgi:hypothetical protein
MDKVKLAILAKLADDAELMGEALKVFDAAPVQAEPKEDKEAGLMAKLLAALAPAKTKDADPMDARLARLEKAVAKLADKKAKDEHEDLEEDLEMMKAFEEGEKAAEDADPEEDEEEKVAKDSDKVSEAELEAAAGGAIDEDADEEEMKKEAHDKAIIKALTAMKPILAKLPKKQQDSIKKALASEMHFIGRTGKANDQYKTVQKSVQAKAKDAAAGSGMPDYSKVGDEIAAKFNPHYKK